MNILHLIKKHKTIRKYANKQVPEIIVNKIIEAGIWGPSIHGFHPGEFVAVNKKSLIKKISATLLNESKFLNVGADVLLRSTAQTVANSRLIIFVYNNGCFRKFAKKFSDKYLKVAEISEVEALSACIQNMLLTAESLGIGSCWTITPLFCKEKIANILKINLKMMALLTFGYPAEEGKRSERKKVNIRFLKK